MKTIKTLFFTLIALFSVQMVQAQCTGSLSVTGTDPTFTFTTTNPNVASAIYSWDFGDGTYSSTPLTVSHTYTTNGSFTVTCFYADSINMCSDFDTIMVTVTSQTGGNCNASFNIGGNGPTFFFTPANTPSSPLGYYNFEWNFGDGSATVYTADMNSIQHTYTTNGTYNVQCILFDSIFCSDTVIIPVVVVNAGGPICDATFAWADSNGTVLFFPFSSDTSLTYSWSFGDGTSSNAMYPTHQYSPTGSGIYQACLTVTGATCTDTYCDSINLNGSPIGCDATFGYYDSVGYLTFFPLFSSASTTYNWTVSTGATSTLENPTFFLTPGTYNVCLAISDTVNSCTDTVCSSIMVVAPSVDIEGFVIMGNTFADSGVVFLIEYDSVAGTLTAVDTTNLDSMGYYIFTNTSAGNYLVKAALSPNSVGYSNYLPTYFAMGSPQIPGGALLWNNADYAVSPSNAFYPIDLVAGTNTGGPAFVGGLVSQGANKVGDPMSDILVIVTDMSGNPVAYEYSDNTGNFTIDNLPYGSYVLYPEVYGKTTTPMNFTLSSSNSNIDNFKIEVNSQTVVVSTVTGINPVPEFSDVVLYPNPVQNELNIDFGKTIAQEITIEMFDVAGRRISVQNVGSTNLVKINTANLNSGVYLIELSSTDGEQVFKFVK